jgi:hypothetical protein
LLTRASIFAPVPVANQAQAAILDIDLGDDQQTAKPGTESDGEFFRPLQKLPTARRAS